jgi:hypothetical protein
MPGRDFEAELRGFLAERVDGLLAAEHRRTHQPRPPRHPNCRCTIEATSEAFDEFVRHVNEVMNRFVGVDYGEPGGDRTVRVRMVRVLVHTACRRAREFRAILTSSPVRRSWRCSACDHEWTDLALIEVRSVAELGLEHQNVPWHFVGGPEPSENRLRALGLFLGSLDTAPPIGPIPPHIRRELRNRVIEIPKQAKRVAPPSDRLPVYRPT